MRRRDIGGGGDAPLENRQWREAVVEVEKRLWRRSGKVEVARDRK